MITTPKYEKKEVTTRRYTGHELVDLLKKKEKMAFVGSIGAKRGLYLIVYDGIVWLASPRITYNLGVYCDVERFVNLIVEESLV